MAAAGGLGCRTSSNDEIAMSLPALRRHDADSISVAFAHRPRVLPQAALRLIGVTALAWGVRRAPAALLAHSW